MSNQTAVAASDHDRMPVVRSVHSLVLFREDPPVGMGLGSITRLLCGLVERFNLPRRICDIRAVSVARVNCDWNDASDCGTPRGDADDT